MMCLLTTFSQAGAQVSSGLVAQAMVPGEVLHYEGHFGIFGKVGEGRMSISGPERMNGETTHRIDFHFDGRVMLRSIRDETMSRIVLSEDDFHSLEFRKDERHPMGRREENVQIFPNEGRWQDADGTEGQLSSSRPLDEVSFLYMVRVLDLAPGDSVALDRHFDANRNPVVVRALETTTTEVPAGVFPVRVMEMEVRDRERFGGTERVILHLTDDARRIPVRIESSMPRAGTLRLVLTDRVQESESNPSAPPSTDQSARGGATPYDGSDRCDT